MFIAFNCLPLLELAILSNNVPGAQQLADTDVNPRRNAVRKDEIEKRLDEINSKLRIEQNIQEGMSIPMTMLKRKFYKSIVGNDHIMKDEVMDAIAGVYEKYGIDII